MTYGYVYFIKTKGMDGPWKIGFSCIPQNRLETLMSWSPFELEIVAQVPGSFADEQYLHRCFARSHRHGEWFNDSERLANAVAQIAAAGSVNVVRSWLLPEGSVRSGVARRREPQMVACIAYHRSVVAAEKRTGERAPRSVRETIDRWKERASIGGCLTPPSEEEMDGLRAYIASAVKPNNRTRHVSPSKAKRMEATP